MEDKKRIILFVTSKCNSKCKHCYISFKGERSPEKTLELTNHFKKKGYEVVIAGAETLLDPRYLESYRAAGQKYILTNGLAILENPSLLSEILVQGIEEIVLSAHFGIVKELNSVPEDKIRKAAELSKIAGLSVTLSSTINRNNFRNVTTMCQKAYSFGADKIKFFRYVISGNARINPEKTLSIIEIEEFFTQIKEARGIFPKDKLSIKVGGNFGPRFGSKGEDLSKENKYCPAGKTLFAIDPEDNVYGCPFLMDFAIGRVNEGELLLSRELCSGKRDRCIIDYLQ